MYACINFLPNFATPPFPSLLYSKKHPTRHNGRSHCLHLYFISLPLPDGVFFFFSLHKAHTFTRPDIFSNVWKMLGNAVPVGKLLFLPVRFLDVNAPIS